MHDFMYIDSIRKLVRISKYNKIWNINTTQIISYPFPPCLNSVSKTDFTPGEKFWIIFYI